MFKSLQRVVLLTSALLIASVSFAGIRVTPMVISIPATQKVGDVKVENMSDNVQYVNVIPSIVDKTKVKSSYTVFNPAKETPEQFGLLVTPRKLVLRPHQVRIVRLVSLHHNIKQDEYYSVEVTPVENPMEEIYGKKKAIEAALRIVVAYEPLIIVLPLQPKQNISYQRDGKTLTMSNKGNTYVAFENVRQCNPAGDQCQKVNFGFARLYVNQTHKVALPYNTPITFTTISAVGSKTVSLK